MPTNTPNNGRNERMSDETQQFERPRQVFPEDETRVQPAQPQYQNYQYQQPAPQSAPQPASQQAPRQEPPRSYDVPEERSSGSGLTGILVGLLVLALIALAALAYMYTRAANQEPPAPETITQTATATVTDTPSPVTQTQTETVTETVTETPDLTRELPTSLPSDLGEGADNVDDLLNEIFGGDNGNGRGGN